MRAFYLAHKNSQSVGMLLTGVSVLVGMFFFGYLRAYLRRSPGVEWLSSLAFGGAIIFGTSALLGAGAIAALTDSPGRMAPATLQTLNVIQNDLSWPMLSIGIAVFYLAVGFAVVKSRALPVWLGWVSVVLGVVSVSMVLAFFSFLALGPWAVIVSIILAQRNPSLDAAAPPLEVRGPVDGRVPSTV